MTYVALISRGLKYYGHYLDAALTPWKLLTDRQLKDIAGCK